MTKHAVIVVGGGPTGLTLAAELALAKVDVALVERRADQALTGSRAGGLYVRTLELLDQRGIVERFLEAGETLPALAFAGNSFDISDLPTRHNYTLALWQARIERLLADWVSELPVTVYREREVVGFRQDTTGAEVALSDGQVLRAGYLVGCDGGRSVIRKSSGIEFPGWDATTSSLLAEVQVTEEPVLGIRRDATGVHAIGRMEFDVKDGRVLFKDTGAVRVMITETQLCESNAPTLEELRAAVRGVYGTDFGIHSPSSITRFTDATRQAATYRDRRVLLAGDSAHVHAPDGGQGLNTGVQDAMNLGWKLAQVVHGLSPDSLLDSYHTERHPVAAWVLKMTMAQVALRRGDARTGALNEVLANIFELADPKMHLSAQLAGLAIHYDFGGGHSLLGRRMPDLSLATAQGTRRVFELMRDARHLLLRFADIDVRSAAPWADRLVDIDVEYAGTWELPVFGETTAPRAVLVRPDGYVAWVGERDDAGLVAALQTWLGPAHTS